ncbi:MAG TPA: phosphoglycerate mutase family protein [Aquaticitalea sp.]|nr:phosphoglycerate mutase family protein [Aquaticitalea sp.]HNU60068.1 phosphoglycerate mutase family protein [Aquaticitalea sp.]
MRYTILTIILMAVSISFSQEAKTDVTTYYFIRHGEKDMVGPSDKNPHLSHEGLARAKSWSSILKDIAFDAIYSTDYHRTRETATPISNTTKIPITLYDVAEVLNHIDGFKNATKGKTVLVVGHSNTNHDFVNAIINQNKYPEIDESNYGTLFIITIIGENITDQLLTIN